jgi:Flp pilus assembly protein TadG
MAVPLLLAVTLGLVWLLALATAQVRMVDATREAARAVARGDSTDEALDRGRLVAPAGAALTVTTLDDRVVVSGSVTVDGVAGALRRLAVGRAHGRGGGRRERTHPP